jgi:plasmid stabilization system protein ParE
MKYTVVVSEPAERELEESARWWEENRSREQSLRWYKGFLKAIRSLSQNPERCPLARENELFAADIRELHYGLGSRPTHRAVFTLLSDIVLVLTVRHVARADLTVNDLDL